MKAPKTIGLARSARYGKFVESGPDSDPALRADVLKIVEALDLVSPVLDALLLGYVRDKQREQSAMFAQTLLTLSALREVVAAELRAVGVTAPRGPILEAHKSQERLSNRRGLGRVGGGSRDAL